jgi:hypothetical protein
VLVLPRKADVSQAGRQAGFVPEAEVIQTSLSRSIPEACHDDLVVKDTIDQNRAPFDSFFDESSFAIERSGTDVAAEHTEFDAQVSKGVRYRKRFPQEALAQPLTPPARQHSHKEITNVCHHLASRGWYIAPAHDLPIGYGNDLWIAFLDVPPDEGTGTFQGRCFQKRQVLVFSSHDIEGGMEAPDVLFPNLTDLNRHSSAPLARDNDLRRYSTEWWPI